MKKKKELDHIQKIIHIFLSLYVTQINDLSTWLNI